MGMIESAASMMLGLAVSASAGVLSASDDEPALGNPVQLTFPEQFIKAGEAYFSPDTAIGRGKIIFQAVPAGAEGDNNYSMYVADLVWEGPQPIGIENVIEVSQPGSANTCGWFHPTREGEILFGTTTVPPQDSATPGYQRGTGRYQWQFPSEMQIATMTIGQRAIAEPLFERDGYT
ncbi:MAG: hypothetical protein AAF747_10790, partial [Planctomycetota bacterium]